MKEFSSFFDDNCRGIKLNLLMKNSLFSQALQVGLFTPDRSFIITNLDAQTIDLERFRYTQANITLFRVLDREFPIQEFKNIDEVLDKERQKCENFRICTPEEIEGINRSHFSI